jgi:hypothetical protein
LLFRVVLTPLATRFGATVLVILSSTPRAWVDAEIAPWSWLLLLPIS